MERLVTDVSFEELGLDSIMISDLNRKVEQWTGTLEASLFFKYTNIESLAAYFAEAYPEVVSRLANRSGVQTSTPFGTSGSRTSLSPSRTTGPGLSSIRSGKPMANAWAQSRASRNEEGKLSGYCHHWIVRKISPSSNSRTVLGELECRSGLYRRNPSRSLVVGRFFRTRSRSSGLPRD